MVAKNKLEPFAIAQGQSMASTFNTPPTDIRGIDNVWYHADWTGTPTGTWVVQVSSNYVPGATLGSAPQNPGTWDSLTMSAVITANSSADSGDWDLNQLGAPYVRLLYTASSGTGTVTITINGKGL